MRHLCRYLKLLGLQRWFCFIYYSSYYLLTIYYCVCRIWFLSLSIGKIVRKAADSMTRNHCCQVFFSSSMLWRFLTDKWNSNLQTESSLIFLGRLSIQDVHTSNSCSPMDFQGLRIIIWPRPRKSSRRCNLLRKLFVSLSSRNFVTLVLIRLVEGLLGNRVRKGSHPRRTFLISMLG